MKITDVKLVLDKESYLAGDNVTGKLVVTTHDPSWSTKGKASEQLSEEYKLEFAKVSGLEPDKEDAAANRQAMPHDML